MKFLKKKEPTVLDGIKKQIREVEEALENCEDSEKRYELYSQYYKLIDRYTEIKKVKDNPAIDYGLRAAGIIAPCILTIWGTKVTMRYEKEDMMTSTAGKQFFKLPYMKKLF